MVLLPGPIFLSPPRKVAPPIHTGSSTRRIPRGSPSLQRPRVGELLSRQTAHGAMPFARAPACGTGSCHLCSRAFCFLAGRSDDSVRSRSEPVATRVRPGAQEGRGAGSRQGGPGRPGQKAPPPRPGKPRRHHPRSVSPRGRGRQENRRSDTPPPLVAAEAQSLPPPPRSPHLLLAGAAPRGRRREQGGEAEGVRHGVAAPRRTDRT